MKKSLLIFIALLCVSEFVQAQLQAGPKAGLSGYQIITGGNDNFRFGLYAGGFFRVCT
jgi:hypothetical protein